jgi:glutathione synthase/RimK-type ligase-like ATP-grasp enzyme
VVKVPDDSFSRGVHLVNTPEEFHRLADELFEETDLVLAQKVLPTQFDWRARRRAAVRVSVPHGAGPLADRQVSR